MAAVSTEPGKGRGSLNFELNLVPCIDLLSSLVLFLLVTAVWMQVSVISASVNSKGASAVVRSTSERVQVRVRSAGYTLTWPAALARKGLPRQIGRNPALLSAVLRKARHDVRGAFPVTALSGDDNVPYNSVVSALDAIKGAGITSVGLSTD